MVNIEFLYFENCPGHEVTWRLLNEVINESGLQIEVKEIELKSPDEVETHRFLGSPSIRINEEDLEGEVYEREVGYGWRCRFYEDSEPGEVKAVPGRDLIRRKLAMASGEVSTL